jgi:sterol desaturase/sphingolipid hydroxylase (fatty acid hydroxylase superfamily)
MSWVLPYIFAYYIFSFEQYIIHNVQHTIPYFCTIHRTQHHQTYSRNNITQIAKHNSWSSNFDWYLYGNIILLGIHSCYIFTWDIIIFQLILGYIVYYVHNEYHNPNTIWKEYSIFKYLKQKHELHHLHPRTNYFLLDPTFDMIFGTFK